MMRCKFCGCTDERPCLIAAIVKADGDVEITFGIVALVRPGERIEMLPCGWLIPEVCSAPACVKKAYEAIGIVIGKRAAA